MAQYSEDSFDRLPAHPDRVGAHRGPARRGRGWIVFGWSALATVVLFGLGVGYLALVNNNIQFTDAFGGGTAAAVDTTPTPTAEPITPITDPSLSVTVLNGTETVGLAGRVGEAAAAGGWTVGTAANASASDVATTTVYYSDPANEAAALGLAQTLGGLPTALDASFEGAALTVVLGADYVGPGAEPAAEEAPADDAEG